MSQTPLLQDPFRARLGGIIRQAETALSPDWQPRLLQFKEPERIVERLQAIIKRCALLNSLLLFDIGMREFNELLRNEIDFVRGAELFLDELGIVQMIYTG